MENRYVLNNIALRSWWLAPRAYIYGLGEITRMPHPLTQEEFDILKECDGRSKLPPSGVLEDLLERKLIRPAKEGEETDEFLKHRSYENRCVPKMGINITERCNFNCLHCYEAVDNEMPRGELSLEECRRLLKEAAECGIQNIMLTGGEPMLHKDFMDIIRSVYENEMTVEKINTNGYFITGELLDELSGIDPKIMFNISYDGAGFHDWMRNKKGAEEGLLEKIRMLVEKGFRVRAAMTLNRVNVGALKETLWKMEELGVHEFRIIRTNESPRWMLNAKDACLTMEEYFDAALGLFEEYAKDDYNTVLNVFHFAKAFSSSKIFYLAPVRSAVNSYRPDITLCANTRENITVVPGGDVFPCTPSTGNYRAAGLKFGNVFERGLRPLLQSSPYLAFVCKGVHAIAEHDEKCGACEYFKQCMGGCRLAALAMKGDVMSHDPSKCVFFYKHYDERLAAALTGYRCVNPVERNRARKRGA